MNVLSLSYRKAPLDVRAVFSFSREEIVSFFRESLPETVTQCVILSTCNRLELYFDGGPDTVRPMQEALCSAKGVVLSALLPYVRVYLEDRAILHLNRVACGIDSMVLGEDEILRQLKEAYSLARENGVTDTAFNTIFQMTFAAAKSIKTETGLSKTPVSIGTLAAREALSFTGGNGTVLLIGASGTIGSATAKNLMEQEGLTLIGTTRSHHGAREETSRDARIRWIPAPERYAWMERADVVISATTSPHYTVLATSLSDALQTEKPRLLLDLAVPPDMDPDLAALPGITLRDLDYFRILSAENNRFREQEAEDAEERARAATDEIVKELRMREILDLLPDLRDRVSETGVEPLIWSLRKLADREQVEAVAKWLADYQKEN
ncbi:MAG: glutamyl-tRNA reductase [Clostridia bacterium]|nr:glutamyl-tRNA reductase [Clostridia bacterium]